MQFSKRYEQGLTFPTPRLQVSGYRHQDLAGQRAGPEGDVYATFVVRLIRKGLCQASELVCCGLLACLGWWFNGFAGRLARDWWLSPSHVESLSRTGAANAGPAGCPVSPGSGWAGRKRRVRRKRSRLRDATPR